MVSLFVKILEENELFFDEDDIQLEQFFVKSGSDHFTSIRTLVNVAKVFFYTKKSNLEELRKLNSVVEVVHLQNTYICGEPIIRIHLRDNPIQKSVIMIALENRSYEMVELFRNWGLDVNDLGETTSDCKADTSKDIRNRFNLWYIIIKFILTTAGLISSRGVVAVQPAIILHKLSKFQEFIEGPAVVGAIFEAMRGSEPDLEFLKKVKEYFPAWFNVKFKKMGATAHELLVKFKCIEGASLLMSYLGPNSENQMSHADFNMKMSKLENYEDFVAYIQENPELLHQTYSGGNSFLHRFADCSHFTGEKMKFLIESGADPNEENSYRENLVDYILKVSYLSDQSINLVTILSMESECEAIRTLISRSPHLILNICEQIFKSKENKAILVHAFELLISSPVFNLETLLFPERVSQVDKYVAGPFQSIKDNPELMKIVTNVCVKLILTGDQKTLQDRDGSRIENYIMVLKAYCQTDGSRLEELFFDMMELIGQKESDNQVSSWRDKYDMTFLMRLVIFSEENFSYGLKIDPLISYIITAGLFDDSYLGYQVKNDLTTRFKEQHINEKAKETKVQNDVLE